MPKQNKAYKFRLYPNKAQATLMQKTFGCVRFVYNKVLANNLEGYAANGKEHKNTFTYVKAEEFLSEVSAAAIQQACRDLMSAYNNFFSSMFGKRKGKKVAQPKFKSKHTSKRSFRLPNQKFRLEGNKIRLEKIGFVRTRGMPDIPADARFISVTVSHNAAGEYYASICAEVNIELYPYTDKAVGIDVGLNDFLVASDGLRVAAPKFFRENQTELKLAQRHLSRKQRGSNSYNKQKLKVAHIHRKISNKRIWFLHDLSNRIVREYGLIGVEDLNIQGMMKGNTSKSIADASWGEFMRQLEYKSTYYGRTFIKIGRFYPSSKTCFHCGYKNADLKRGQSEWVCPSCNSTLDRDLNAAYNIRREAVTSVESTDYSGGGTGDLARPKKP